MNIEEKKGYSIRFKPVPTVRNQNCREGRFNSGSSLSKPKPELWPALALCSVTQISQLCLKS